MTKSRHETNRQIRQILIRHDADITRIDYSITGSTIYFTGELKKMVNTANEFALHNIYDLLRDISKIDHALHVQFDFTNWAISSSGSCWKIIQKQDGVPSSVVSVKKDYAEDKMVNIEGKESITNVLKEISKKMGDK